MSNLSVGRSWAVVFLVGWVAVQPAALAQDGGGEAARSVPPGSSLEERIAVAKSVRVMTSILDLRPGSTLTEAHEKLDSLCAAGTRPKEESGEAGEADEDEGRRSGVGEEKPEGKTGVGETAAEGRKTLWQLGSTDYSAVFVIADESEHIVSITGLLRADRLRPFDEIGDVAKAPVHDASGVAWDVLRPDWPLFRVLAKGRDGKASSLMIFAVQKKRSKAWPQPAPAAATPAGER